MKKMIAYIAVAILLLIEIFPIYQMIECAKLGYWDAFVQFLLGTIVLGLAACMPIVILKTDEKYQNEQKNEKETN